jgi:DNA-binding transcriptional MerR regulator
LAPELPRHRPVFAISVTAELTGVNPQNLRAYEARGLVRPSRTAGGTRRYSGADLDRIHRIAALLDAGLNLVGIAHVLALEDQAADLRAEIARLRARIRTSTQSDSAPTEL